MMFIISSLVVFFLCGKVLHKVLLSCQQSSFKHSRPFKSVVCTTPSPPRCPELRSVLGNPLIPLLISSPLFFPALRSTLRSLPVGELQSTGVGGHHGDGRAAPGSHRGALARGSRAARPVGQNGSSGRGGESRGCSQVGRFFSCTASM